MEFGEEFSGDENYVRVVSISEGRVNIVKRNHWIRGIRSCADGSAR
ncbi:hypothetical protein CCASP_06340 [Corynebacterium caspium DSM 44850]|nr:hypothetical protein CCASP_06340 [Corynebacterium caspium DSM 44850]